MIYLRTDAEYTVPSLLLKAFGVYCIPVDQRIIHVHCVQRREVAEFMTLMTSQFTIRVLRMLNVLSTQEN